MRKLRNKKQRGYLNEFLLCDEMPNDISEAYKEIRTNLLYMPFETKCRKIVVTSSIAKEGKTITAINLSKSLSQLGLKVLLIDADMRASVVRKYLDITDKGGLSEYLAGISKARLLKNISRLGMVDLLLAGEQPPNPSELLMNIRMNELMELLSDEYDYIILDTPPVNVVTDATTLAQVSDGYLIVVRDGYSDINDVQRTVDKLSKLGANICGIILNDIEKRDSGNKYYRYRGYYGDIYY
ncbi:MAG: CpsD/CapB family tyrosine-protein kinase [Lachnospiraceae bacterium]|nr:CpsD/CapB family tyrosine-protein kinase [Lachnospiraceae bacterium]